MESSTSEMATEETPSTKSSPKSTRSEDSTELAVSNAKRRKSDGEVGGPVKIKPPNATPSSHSTSSSPLISRKSDPGGPKREPSPTPSSGDSEASSSISVENSTPKTNEPTYRIGEKVMVDVNGLFRMGSVKYVGATEFAAGDWVGVAFDRPYGKHSGTVKGVKYFKCKDKHGVFVKKEKLIQSPSVTGATSSPSPRFSHGSKSASPSARRKPSTNPSAVR
ncbi:CAP-Gly domain-containing linker protein 2 [Geodia barretti]|uniref:CAP-Gly domain-containing linker protein 2 n=1 Tax=Geodia barretti TaxID=519541 RepID=A0AA35R0Z5_GEOBA|nr:CAP-Gly domain-containing linker protein 2 [Geodia barretti]